jgi:glutathione S-transferase
MKIYGHPVSGGTRIALMAAAEKNIPVELHTLNFFAGEHKQPAHLARQPFGKMPAAEHDGFTMFESRAIVSYIANAFPGGEQLVPTDPKQRALVTQWINVEAFEFYPAAHPLMIELNFKKAWGMGDPDPATIERLRAQLKPVLEVLDKALEGKTYLVGDKFSIADLVFISDLDYLRDAGETSWMGKFENVKRWAKAIASRPSWEKAKSYAATAS